LTAKNRREVLIGAAVVATSAALSAEHESEWDRLFKGLLDQKLPMAPDPRDNPGRGIHRVQMRLGHHVAKT
jgi:hypothetical protein